MYVNLGIIYKDKKKPRTHVHFFLDLKIFYEGQ